MLKLGYPVTLGGLGTSEKVGSSLFASWSSVSTFWFFISDFDLLLFLIFEPFLWSFDGIGNISECLGFAISHYGALIANLWLRPKTSAYLSAISYSLRFYNSLSSNTLPRPLISTSSSAAFGTPLLTYGLKVQSLVSWYSLLRLSYAIRAILACYLAFKFSE